MSHPRASRKSGPRRARRTPHDVAALLGCALLLTACSQDIPTSLVLKVEAAPSSVGALDDLRLTIFGPRGLELEGYRLPQSGSPSLPASAVLYPPAAGRLRLLLQGRRAVKVVAEGVAEVDVSASAQARVTLRLEEGRLSDGDGDGVPDAIDGCPELPDPDQLEPCAGADGGGDAAIDAATDAARDAKGDTRRDLFIEPDIVKPCTEPSDCDDGNACTDDRCQTGFCTYGPVTCKPSGDPCRQAPRCDPAQGCVEDPKADNTPCEDKEYCTVNEVCVAGSCVKDARDCTSGAPACSLATCDEQQNQCTFAAAPSGSACDDGDPCTQGDVCNGSGVGGGSCEAPPLAPATFDPDNMDRRGDRNLVVDSRGVVHAVYSLSATGQRGLRYAKLENGTWTFNDLEPVGPGTNGRTPSLAIDGQDRLHVLYRQGSTLRYRRFGAGSTPIVEDTVTTTIDTALAVTSSGVVYAVHGHNDGLRFAHRAANGTWGHTTVFTPATSGKRTIMFGIALDAGGKVHVAHGRQAAIDQKSDRLWHTSNESGSWVTTLVADTQGPGHLPSIVVDGSGAVHILHSRFDSSSPQLRLESRASPTSSWTSQSVAGETQTSYPTLLLGTANSLHVVYRNWAQQRLRHRRYASGSWSSALTIDSGSNEMGRWACAARGPDGRLHAIYERLEGGQVRYASFSACP